MTGAGAIDSIVLGDLYGTTAMRTVFCDRERVQAMLDVEAALAKAEASTGVIPKEAAPAIATACRADLYDLADLGRRTAPAGNPAIPLIKMLTDKVAGDARRYVHWGATSQDIIDTGLMLQVRAAIDVLLPEVTAVADAAAKLADAHRKTPVAGRTFLQHALPIPFGYKAAVWLGLVSRAHARLTGIRRNGLALQFGGAAGTLASLGGNGAKVADALARDLKLVLPDMPWHSARDRIADIAAAVAIAAGGMGKIATDIALLMQTEVAEAFEPAGEGKGGSSALPHTRNPVGATLAIAAAAQAGARLPLLVASIHQEHERGVGMWHAEWGAIAELFVLTAGAVNHIRVALEGLTVDAACMRDNIETTRGLIFSEAVTMALATTLGREAAHKKVEDTVKTAVTTKRHLRDVLAEDKAIADSLGKDGLSRAFDPMSQAGASDEFISRAIDSWKKSRG